MTDPKTALRAVVFANGVMEDWPEDLQISPDKDLIICADGGLKHCLAWGLTPNALIGDMDSAAPDDVARVQDQGAEVLVHPARKDATDLELALDLANDLALERGMDEIIILGALGRRWDMSLANVMLLVRMAEKGTRVSILEGAQRIFCFKGPGSLTITGRPGETVSLIPLTSQAMGVTLHGLEYPLTQAILPLGTSLGVSNVLIGDEGRVELESGCLLVLVGGVEK